jgi:hypothetical protein
MASWLAPSERENNHGSMIFHFFSPSAGSAAIVGERPAHIKRFTDGPFDFGL